MLLGTGLSAVVRPDAGTSDRYLSSNEDSLDAASSRALAKKAGVSSERFPALGKLGPRTKEDIREIDEVGVVLSQIWHDA